MFKKISLAKIEMVLASALAFFIAASFKDLPYNGPCGFFFGEPTCPFDE